MSEYYNEVVVTDSSDSDDSYVEEEDDEEPGMTTINIQIRDLVRRRHTILAAEQRKLRNLKELRTVLRQANIGEAKAALEGGCRKDPPRRKRRATTAEPLAAVRKSPRLQLAKPTEQVTDILLTDNTTIQADEPEGLQALPATGSREVGQY